MKKKGLYLVIMTLSVIFWGCDPDRYYDYFIINSCDEAINVKIEACSLNCRTKNAHKYEILNIQIEPNTTQLILSDTYFQPLQDYMIEYFFEKITIVKGTDTSKVNYVDKDLWEFKKTSKNHANSYLTVRPEDFENE